jgi:leader peptidase (prepilin peptidase)/N-methyltransferase
MGLIGLLVGTTIAFMGPRLVAYRLETPPELPPPTLLVPIAGPWLARVAPLRPLLLQAAMAGILAGMAAHMGWTAKLALASLYSVLLVTIGYIDINHRLVLNRLTYPGTIFALVLSVGWPGFSTYPHPVNALLGAAAGLLVFGALQLLGRGAMGMGDTKLALLIGAMVGFPSVFTALVSGVVLGGLGGLFFLIVLRRGRKSYMAYAPYLVAGTIVYFLTSS